ncbi:iron chelate uptake ABC transporter family permease subunit [uncultured Actinobaculum sp.]|uniref:FecCD family ABC transporter permease n=1 Tax=uncultured Actinobaculum sp. TaxID=655643 RepID=UPI002805026D|nr:iron chelate uptake ABC transporter family permease subunit [uncultured Actinobaculum sp.]
MASSHIAPPVASDRAASPTATRAATTATASRARHPAVARKRRQLLLIGLITLAIITCASIAIGARSVPLNTVLDALLDRPVSELDAHAVLDSRLPRTAAGLLVGCALGMAGAVMQGVARNPLADPGILGISAGSAFAVTLGIGLLNWHTPSHYTWLAMLGAALATGLVLVIGTRGAGRADPVRTLLAGVALSAVLQGFTTALRLANPRTFNETLVWQAGTLEGRGWAPLLAALPFLAVGVAIAALISGPLNGIALGDDAAGGLGIQVGAVRLWAALAVTLLAGGAVAICGPIAFIGLMAPHLIRNLIGPDQRWILGLCALWAPIILLTADILGRFILPSGEMPVSVVAAFVGAPVLIAVVRRKGALS